MNRALTTVIVVGVLFVLPGCAGASIDAEDSDRKAPVAAPAKEDDRPAAPKVEKVVVPDVDGMSADDATAALSAAGFAVVTDGEGTTVTAQFPAGGTSVEKGSEVEITLSTPEPEGTRDDPFPFGTTLVGMGAGEVEEATILVGAAQWGAGDVVMAENQFNDPAPDGFAYVLLPVTITNVGSEEAIVPWLAFNISYVAPDGRSYDEASAVIPGEMTDIGDLYVGGSATGNLAFVLPIDAQGGVWAVEYGFFSDPVFVVAG